MATRATTSSHRRAKVLAVGVSAIALAAGAVSAPAAVAGGARGSDITAHSSKDSVEAGEQFVVRGRFSVRGHPVGAGRLVKIQSAESSGFEDIEGVRTRTNENGRYRVRVILFREGERVLRAVGRRPGALPNAFERFTVCVDCDFSDV